MNDTLKNLFFKFDGRVGRQTYWIGSLIAGAVYTTIAQACALTISIIDAADLPWLVMLLPGSLWFAAVVLMTWASLAISVKRWHDRDKSGWWTLIALIPIVGWIWSFVEVGFLKGSDDSNQFGADPLASKTWPF